MKTEVQRVEAASARLDRVADAADRVARLLANPQPGIGMWHTAVVGAISDLRAEIPPVCTLHDVARVMRISMATAYRRQALGLFRPFLLETGGHPRYSGALLEAWASKTLPSHINGSLSRPRTFGRKRSAA
jgi:hypothetical protein